MAEYCPASSYDDEGKEMGRGSYCCPCLICVELSERSLPDCSTWMSSGGRASLIPEDGDRANKCYPEKNGEKNGSVVVIDYLEHLPLMPAAAPAIPHHHCDRSTTTTATAHGAALIEAAAKSRRRIIGMDGNIQEYPISHEEDIAPTTQSPKPPRSGRRMQRRCSVTKFNLEDTMTKVQQEEMDQREALEDSTIPPQIAPALVQRKESPPNASMSSSTSAQPPVRTRMPRRCSVTKFNLEETLHRVQTNTTKEEVKDTERPSPPSVMVAIENNKVYDRDGSYPTSSPALGLGDTPESKRTFRARLPWGRAA